MLSEEQLKAAYNGCKEGGHLGALAAVAEAAVRDAVGGEEPKRDWPEAADPMRENIYQNRCCECSQLFMGWKRRPVCAVCARPQASAAVPEKFVLVPIATVLDAAAALIKSVGDHADDLGKRLAASQPEVKS